MAGIEKYYEITEVYAWQWEGNTNITIEDIPEEIRNEVTMLKVERSIKTSFTEESNQLFFNYKGYQYNLFPGDFLIFEYNEFIDGFQFICVEREKDSLKKYRKCNSILFLPTSKVLDPLNPKDAIEANAINFFNESCQALGILVDLNKKAFSDLQKCGKTNKECFPTTIEEQKGNIMDPIPKTKIIRLKGQKLAKLNETIHQRDQHKCIYCGNRVDPGEKFHHEHNGIKSDQIEYGVLLCMDCHTERHHGKKCNDVKEYCRKYLINLYGESIYSK